MGILAEDVALPVEPDICMQMRAVPQKLEAHFGVLREACLRVEQRLDDAFKSDILRKSAYIVMTLYHCGFSCAAFNNIRINRSLAKIFYLSKLAGFFLEYTDKLLADYLALFLRLAYPCKPCEKTLACIYTDKVHIELLPEYLLNIIALILAEKSMVNKYTGELLSYCLVYKKRCY